MAEVREEGMEKDGENSQALGCGEALSQETLVWEAVGRSKRQGPERRLRVLWCVCGICVLRVCVCMCTCVCMHVGVR